MPYLTNNDYFHISSPQEKKRLYMMDLISVIYIYIYFFNLVQLYTINHVLPLEVRPQLPWLKTLGTVTPQHEHSDTLLHASESFSTQPLICFSHSRLLCHNITPVNVTGVSPGPCQGTPAWSMLVMSSPLCLFGRWCVMHVSGLCDTERESEEACAMSCASR